MYPTNRQVHKKPVPLDSSNVKHVVLPIRRVSLGVDRWYDLSLFESPIQYITQFSQNGRAVEVVACGGKT